MKTWPRYKALTDEELRSAYFEATNWHKHYHDKRWPEKASGYYDQAMLAAREMTRRNQPGEGKGDE